MDYLFHYTSMETLALILSNRTICFNNLLNVDDIEEAETGDMGQFGRFVYVSCWTEDTEESIPLWNLYTPNMHGVRIKLPKFPFKKFYYKKGELFLTQDVETFINIQKVYDEDKISIVAEQPKLFSVEYTNNSDKLFPKIKHESYDGAFEEFLQAKDLSDFKDKKFSISYDLSNIGKCKRKSWEFQKEWRYSLSVSPMGLQENNPPSLEKQQELLKRISNTSLVPHYNRIFLDIDDTALDSMEVVLGPKMTNSEKILVKSLLNQYCPNCQYRDSSLRIR